MPDSGITGATPVRMTSTANDISVPSARNDSAVGNTNQVVEGTVTRMTVSVTAPTLMSAVAHQGSR